MAQYIFSRTEKKYAVPPHLYEEIKARVLEFMDADPTYPIYTLCNVYFDTDSYELARRSIEKPVFKEKLRVRSYGTPTPDSKVYVEVKKKYKGVVYKRRAGMTYTEAQAFLLHGLAPKDTQIIRELDYTRRFYDLKPKVYLAYDREAFSGKNNPDLRLTFDNHIRFRLEDIALSKGAQGTELLPDGTRIMEIKAVGAFPPEIVRLLADFKLTPFSFSKYGTIYKQYILSPQSTPVKEYSHV